MVTLKLHQDSLSPDLRRLIREAESNGPLARVMGRAVANTLRKHFRERNRTPNALGGARTNFWSRVAESVQTPHQAGSKIVVAVSHPAIAQKVFGGTVRPSRWKNLAIPIHPSVHDIRARSIIEQLRYIKKPTGVALFVRITDGTPLYVLKKSVTQAPDPKALPTDAAMEKAVTTAARIHLDRRA